MHLCKRDISVTYLVHCCGRWGNYFIKSHDSLEGAIAYARQIDAQLDESACLIRHLDTNEFWMSARQSVDGCDEWVKADISDVRRYYRTAFGDKDPFGLELARLI